MNERLDHGTRVILCGLTATVVQDFGESGGGRHEVLVQFDDGENEIAHRSELILIPEPAHPEQLALF